MNLIDRDKALKTIPSEEMVARMAVMSAPVVDAIPIEWIKHWVTKDGLSFPNWLNWMLYDWQKEQEEKNGTN